MTENVHRLLDKLDNLFDALDVEGLQRMTYFRLAALLVNVRREFDEVNKQLGVEKTRRKARAARPPL